MRYRAIVGVLALVVACGTESAPEPAHKQSPPVLVGEFQALTRMQVARVDVGATFLAKLVEHVPDDGTRRGVRRELERWRVDDGPVATEVYLSGPSREALEAHVREAAVAVPPDRALAFERLDDGRWRTHVLITAPVLDETAVMDADAIEEGGRTRVRLRLTPAGGARLHALTTAAVGGKLAVRIDDTVVAAPVVQAPITGGVADVTLGGGATLADAEALAAELRGEG